MIAQVQSGLHLSIDDMLILTGARWKGPCQLRLFSRNHTVMTYKIENNCGSCEQWDDTVIDIIKRIGSNEIIKTNLKYKTPTVIVRDQRRARPIIELIPTLFENQIAQTVLSSSPGWPLRSKGLYTPNYSQSRWGKFKDNHENRQQLVR